MHVRNENTRYGGNLVPGQPSTLLLARSKEHCKVQTQERGAHLSPRSHSRHPLATPPTNNPAPPPTITLRGWWGGCACGARQCWSRNCCASRCSTSSPRSRSRSTSPSPTPAAGAPASSCPPSPPLRSRSSSSTRPGTASASTRCPSRARSAPAPSPSQVSAVVLDELAAPAACLPFSVRVPRHFES